MSGRWATFDCYGTLIDWRAGMTDALESVAPGRAQALLDAYHAFELEVEAREPFVPYRTMLAEALRLGAERAGVDLEDEALHVLSRTLPTWPAFPDAAHALAEARAEGWRLGILSNVDRDLIAGTLATRLDVPFDAVVTADEVRSYKPAAGHFDGFRARHEPETWVHVGCSVHHDIVPARQRGLPAILIDREGAATGVPDGTTVLPDLRDLAAVLS